MFGALASKLRTALDVFKSGTYVSRRTTLNFIPAADHNITVADNVAQDRVDVTIALASTYRVQLAADTTYYVRTDGNDANTGLTNTSGGAFLTIQQAVNTVANLDNNGHAITIQIGDGTYTGAVTLKSYIGSGSMTINGNVSTPSNVLISVTGNNCFTANSVVGRWTLQNLKMSTTTSGDCVNVQNLSIVALGPVVFGACAANHCSVRKGGVLNLNSNYTINGNASQHWNTQGQGNINGSSQTITLSGTPAFSTFLVCTLLAFARVDGITFSGSATGTRYFADGLSLVYTASAGATYLPGNANGSTSNGAIYE